MTLEVKQYPEPVLKTKCELVELVDGAFDPSVIQLAALMFETMRKERGIGLAAPQVGVSIRLIVGEVQGVKFALVNPVITKSSEQTTVLKEGCLSFKGRMHIPVRRPKQVEVRALTLQGQPIRLKARGLLAACLQHEIDHLDGVTLADKGLKVPESEQVSPKVDLGLTEVVALAARRRLR